MAATARVAVGTSPKLNLAQRLHLNVYGYVLLENAVTSDERLDALRIYHRRKGDHHLLLGHLVEYNSALLEYATHPKLLPLVEEIVGGSVRLKESEAIINRRDPGMIHQIVAKAGSVLLFPESLLHRTTPIRCDTERIILVSGYTPPMRREWPGNEISLEFIEAHRGPPTPSSPSDFRQRELALAPEITGFCGIVRLLGIPILD